MYPIAQVQEPYSPVAYLAQRVPLIELLRLDHPDPETVHHGGMQELSSAVGGLKVEDEEEEEKEQATAAKRTLAHDGQLWTAWDICDGNPFSVQAS